MGLKELVESTKINVFKHFVTIVGAGMGFHYGYTNNDSWLLSIGIGAIAGAVLDYLANLGFPISETERILRADGHEDFKKNEKVFFSFKSALVNILEEEGEEILTEGEISDLTDYFLNDGETKEELLKKLNFNHPRENIFEKDGVMYHDNTGWGEECINAIIKDFKSNKALFGSLPNEYVYNLSGFRANKVCGSMLLVGVYALVKYLF